MPGASEVRVKESYIQRPRDTLAEHLEMLRSTRRRRESQLPVHSPPLVFDHPFLSER